MRIKSGHIDNFGKINDYDFSFVTQNVNIINKDNSWGKTTFSVFLKAMFYGMEYNSRKSNERKQYMPWQGGLYGGSLVIDTDDKSYKIERTFGIKEKDDTFRLIDLETGKESSRYSQKIGQEIFGIDRDSFAKSLFIPQCQIQTSMTDSLNAKIGNLTDAKDDISNYEAVKKVLEEKKKEYTRARSGKIALLEKELRGLEEKEMQRKNIEKAVGIVERHITEKNKELADLLDVKKKISDELDLSTKNAQNEALLQNAINNLEQTTRIQNAIIDKYDGKIIYENDVINLKNEFEIIKNLKHQIEILSVKESEKHEYAKYKEMFEEGVPNKEFFECVKEIIGSMKTANASLKAQNDEDIVKEYERVKLTFSDEYPDEEEINFHIKNYYKAEGIRKEVLEAEVECNSVMDNTKQTRAIPSLPGLVLGIVLMVAGVVLMLAMSETLFLASSVLGVIIILVVVIFSVKKNQSFINQSMKESQKMLDDIDLKKKEIQRLEDLYKKYVRKFHVRYSENILEVLMEIRDRYQELEKLRKQLVKIKESEKIYRNSIKEGDVKLSKMLGKYCEVVQLSKADLSVDTKECQEVDNLISRYEMTYEQLLLGMNMYEQLKEKISAVESVESRLKEHINTYRCISREYITHNSFEDTSENISVYGDFDVLNPYRLEADFLEYTREENNRIKFVSQIKKLSENINNEKEGFVSYDDYRVKLSECEAQINIVSEDINRHKRDLELKYTELEETDDIENEILQKKNQIAGYKEKYKILEDTLGYLQIAKDRFSARYLGPMRSAFVKYLKLINGYEGTGIKPEDLDIDIELNATLSFGSLSKSKENLSKGYQDLVELCIRFALIDVMCDKEKPVIILDDPFVNMDKRKIDNALDMLEQVGEEYQIIYFTCHESRT